MEKFESKDKQVVPFLLTQPKVKFLGTRLDGSILYFQFSPPDKCQKLANDFMARQAPPVDPKTLLDAVDSFRDRIFEFREKIQQERRLGNK
ncbi:hypothetical protein ACFL0Y_03770 [Patescibacteria group bacterium]